MKQSFFQHATAARLICIAGTALAAAGSARADIMGFDNLSGWTYRQGDGGTTADLPNPDTLQITSGNGQRRSVFYNTPQNVTQFSASFTYRAASIQGSLVEQGITLCFQNDSRGPEALGGGGGGLGYASTPGNTARITPSAAIALFNTSSPNQTWNGFWTGGTRGNGNSIAPNSAFAFRDLHVEVVYDAPILTVTIDDPVIGMPFARNYVVPDLAATVGGSTAYVGFTTSTGDNFGNGGASQFISNFQFTSVPEPASVIGLILAAISLRRR